MDEIRNRIYKIVIDGDFENYTLDNLFKSINSVENENDKKDLYCYFLESVKERFKNENINAIEAVNRIGFIKGRLIGFANLSEDYIDKIFEETNFDVFNIVQNKASVIDEIAPEAVDTGIVSLENNEEKENNEIEVIGSDDYTIMDKIDNKNSMIIDTYDNGEIGFDPVSIERQSTPSNEDTQDQLDDDTREIEKINNRIDELKEKLNSKNDIVLSEFKHIESDTFDAFFRYTKDDLTPEEMKAVYLFKQALLEDISYLEEAKKAASNLEERNGLKFTLVNVLNKLEKGIEQKEVEQKKELDYLKNIRDMYYKLIADAEVKADNDKIREYEIDDFVDNFINHNPETVAFSNYKNRDKLINELKEDIKNNLKIKKIEKKEHNKKLLLKGLVAATGFVTGLGLSCVPGVSAIKMTIAVTKLASTAVNFWAKKHPDGKIAKIKTTTIDKVTTRFPNMTAKIQAMHAKLKKAPINTFINGMAAGYTVGNLIELFTGETLFEHLQGDPAELEITEPIETTPNINKDVPGPAVDTPDIDTPDIDTPDIDTPDIEIDDPIIPDDSIVDAIKPSDINLMPGEAVDISSISEGLVSSTATDSVNLMTQVGENVMFDRAVTLPNGKVMWHFMQPNGAGYAWFEASKVQEVLAKAAEVASKTR